MAMLLFCQSGLFLFDLGAVLFDEFFTHGGA